MELRVIVEPVADRDVSAVVPPMVPETFTVEVPALRVRAWALSMLLPKLIAPGTALVLTVTVPVKSTGGGDEKEFDVTLLPRITSEALVKAMGPSLATPPTTPPKVIVPVPAVRVSGSTPAVVALTVLLKRTSPPPAELLIVGVAVNVTGLQKVMSPLVVVILAPKETVPPPLCIKEPPIAAVAAVGNVKVPV